MTRFALLSLYRSLARHKIYTVLNLGGLSVGIAVFVILGLYVRFETSYERWLPRHDQIYMVETALHLPGSPFNGAYPATMAGLLEQMRQDFPNITGTRIRGGKRGGSVTQDGEAVAEDVAQVDPSFFDVFDLPMVEGDGRRALADPNAALISRSAARKYFGDADPVGKAITVSVDGPAAYHVAGIFEDLPPNTELQFSILIPIPRTPPPGAWDWYQWGTASVSTWLRFATPAEARAFEEKMPAFVDRRAAQMLGPNPSKFLSLPLLPIGKWHLQPPGAESAGRKLTVTALGIMGVLTLLIGMVNYVNLATARSGLRAREVAMRKVLGADRATLVRQFLGEALLTVGVAAFLGLILAELGLPLVNAAGGLSLSIPYLIVLPALLVLIAVIGVAAGFYPALLLSRYPAAAVLASAHAPGGGRSGARTREVLVIVQFGLAVTFILGTIILIAQTRHVRIADLGFQRAGLLVVPSLADKTVDPTRARALLTAFRDLPGVVSVGVANAGPGGDGNSTVDVVEIPGQPGPGPTMRVITTGPRFFQTYAPRLLAGRVFDDAHGGDDSTDPQKMTQGRNIVLNRKAVTALGFASPEAAIGKTVGGARPRTIIGVIDELRFFSPRVPDEATYYLYVRDLPPSPIGVLRFTGNPGTAIDAVRTTWRRLAPTVPPVVETADKRLAQFYEADDRAARLFGIGAGLAVLIACVGLWGLASFSTTQRVKEIGIRKTLGASSSDILKLLVGQFLRPVLIANLLAWPLAYVAMRWWLAGFGDRVALSPVYFVAASLVAVGIAVATVLGQAMRASRAEPAWALRHD